MYHERQPQPFHLSPNDEVLFDVNNIEIDIAEALTTTFFNSYNYTFFDFWQS